MMTVRTGVALAAALAVMLGATACNRGERESATVSQGDVDRAALRVTDVELGRGIDANKNVTDETDDFRPNDTIYASVKTTGTAPGTLVARWTYQDGQVVDETTQNISPTGDAATEFHIVKPDGFPTGNYKLEILLGGTVVETEEFEVK
jgi:hypothetical protein